MQPLTDGLSLVTQPNGPLGLITGEVCFLLNGSRSEPMAARMLGIAEMLQSAKRRVVSENGVYTVAGAKTQGGNPVSSESRGLMEAIAFERSLLRRLSATKTVGV